MDRSFKIIGAAAGCALIVGVALIWVYRATEPNGNVQTLKLDFNGPTNEKSQQEAKKALTQTKARELLSVLQMHYLKTNEIPKSFSDLVTCKEGEQASKCEIAPESLKDGWGNNFEFVRGVDGKTSIRSKGMSLDSTSDDIEVFVPFR